MKASSPPVMSVITPSYNQGEFIEETIKSVISQEGDFFIEYIVMDGGSNDESVDIIKKYDNLLKDGKWPLRCRGITYSWVSEKDKGQVNALEKGFSRATGDIGVWLNSDDTFYDSGVFALVLGVFEKDPALKMVTGDGVFIDRDGAETGRHHVDAIDVTELVYLDYHILQPATFVSMDVHRTELLDSSYNFCFDAEYFIRLIKKGYPYRKLEENLACFRFYPEIKTLSGGDKRYRESLRVAREYGRSRIYYLISAFYKYWIIVLRTRHPESALVKRLTRLFRVISYRLIIGRVRW